MSDTPIISAIIPARNEAPVISACIESLARQPEIAEILVVDDHSTDKTADTVRGLIPKIPQLRLIEADALPKGWIGKSHAVWIAAQQAKSEWLLFTDADTFHLEGAAARALEIAGESKAAMVSFSPEQILVHWYERALIPFVYCRLARQFSFEQVNDPAKKIAAANGQFLMVRRDAYESVGGHASIAGEVLEDVAVAWQLKSAGYPIWFGSGKGVVQARMYRSFRTMWQGWTKNLYLLMGGTPVALWRELESVLPWMALAIFLFGFEIPIAAFLGIALILFRQLSYGRELVRNQYSFRLIIYYLPAVFLYSLVLWRSFRCHSKGRVRWKGREYPVGASGASK
ncbi:MAG TPA: glycosyltransferase family 2 protein [Candidatus Acidoferrum sp.]|nr:glycosyltransferase family 2 protein [Candidatus Acidoferrum sp.]